MHDVGWHHEVTCVRSKDAQKQLARTSLKNILRDKHYVISCVCFICHRPSHVWPLCYNERQKCCDIPIFLCILGFKLPFPHQDIAPSPQTMLKLLGVFIPVQHCKGGGGLVLANFFGSRKKWNRVNCQSFVVNVSSTFVAHCPNLDLLRLTLWANSSGVYVESIETLDNAC